ncbi:MAG: 4Fe-4S binding protein [Anaerolineae bacterium]|nr:4Fe-4S binding protein [Anaerolineae bacterium]
MSRVLSFDADTCVGCHICEEVCSDTWFKTTDRELSSIRIHEERREDELVLRAVYCVQCGECIAVCPVMALSQDRRGIVRLRKQLCVGCLSCVGFCPYLAMFYHASQTEPFKCVACGRCAEECPAEALAVVEVETPRAPGLQV